ncbi:RING-type domain-containing protein [Favolaschia claudopus]|uniref:RING-type domain-containing protein n=1 Tax=Favolaschia claudopus TaxID=2862362 RepID=A0AAW0DW43_9AGAR
MTSARIAGSTPGVIDSTQPSRLLRRPSSTLSFATFDPRVASADHGWDMRSLTLNEELYRPKRVVIETTCSGESSWRFVPKARWEDGVVDEGSWPRVVDLCGQLVEFSQDQWDIYKLDPAYDCVVRQDIPAIIVAEPKPKAEKQPLGKHRMSSAEPCPEMPPTKILHFDEDSEEDEVADMVDDSNGMPGMRRVPSASGDNKKKIREVIEQNRRERREKAAARSERLATREDVFFNFAGQQPIQPQRTGSPIPDIGPKRKVASLFDSIPIRAQDDPDYRPTEEDSSRNTHNYSPSTAAKRTRTFSPGAAKRNLDSRRLERGKKKREQRQKELQRRKQQRFQVFLNEIYSDVSPRAGFNNQPEPDPIDASDDSDDELEDISAEVDPEEERQTFIAEARRKLAELDADRPLWEEHARKREQLEREEQEAQKARKAERRAAESRKAEEERKARQQQERQKQAQAEEEERVRIRAGAERARRERERQQRNERWSYGLWTTQRALERYRVQSEAFDATKFSSDEPLSFEDIPWPMLNLRYSVEDVDWAAVEGFFNGVRQHFRSQEFASFIEKSHRRFHPDRWRSRGLLKSVADETERACLEVAANTVAQALTPLWRDHTGR